MTNLTCPNGHNDNLFIVRTPIFEKRVTAFNDGVLATGPTERVGYRENSVLLCRAPGCLEEMLVPDGSDLRTEHPYLY